MAQYGNKNSSVAGKLLLVLLAALVLAALLMYYDRNVKRAERFSTPGGAMQASHPAGGANASTPLPSLDGASNVPLANTGSSRGLHAAAAPAGLEHYSSEAYRPVDNMGAAVPASANPQDRLRPEDLLPKDAANSKWAQMNPAGQGDVKDQNFLTAGYHLGVDTQGSSLRNASHDMRSTPPNPRYRVSIWNQSDIEPDMHRRPLE